MNVINNHDVWGIIVVYFQSTMSIVHIPAVVKNREGDTVIRGFSSTSLLNKLEVDINTDSLLNTVTKVEPAKIDSHNSVLPPPYVNRHTKASEKS